MQTIESLATTNCLLNLQVGGLESQIQELRQHIDGMVAAGATCWVSALQRLPDSDINVLVWDGVDVWLGYFEDDEWRTVDSVSAPDVTHWAELPEGPQS